MFSVFSVTGMKSLHQAVHNSLEVTMKKLLITAALLAVTASMASAQGISLNWGQCYPQNTALINRNLVCYDCVPYSGVRIVTSFTAPASMATVGTTALIDVTYGTAQPAWWNWAGTGCRKTAGGPDAGAKVGAYNGTQTLCASIITGATVVPDVLTSLNGFKGPNTARLVCDLARDGTFSITGGTHYAAQQLNINNDGSSVDCGGSTPDLTPVCLGCSTPATFALNEVQVYPQTGPPTVLTAVNGRNYVHGQNGVGVPTPAKNKSWGAVKSLYRN
jgi:hypothetical protein